MKSSVRKMSSVAERREMKPRTDWVVVSMGARIEGKWIAVYATEVG